MFFRRSLPVVFALVLTTTFAASAQRLPGGVRPEAYKLTLTPDLQAATFTGSETIEVSLDAPSRSITLNAAGVRFVGGQAYARPVAAYSYGRLGAQPVGLTALEADKHPQTAVVSLDAAKEQATFTFPN